MKILVQTPQMRLLIIVRVCRFEVNESPPHEPPRIPHARQEYLQN